MHYGGQMWPWLPFFFSPPPRPFFCIYLADVFMKI